MTDKQKLDKLIQDLFKFEKENLHSNGIHQITIDFIENLEDELAEINFDDLLCPIEDLIGSYAYQIGNILEICKEDTTDYSIFNKLLTLLNKN